MAHISSAETNLQVALLLLVGGEHLDVGQREQDVHAGAAEGHARAGGLLVLDGLELVRLDAGAAELLGHVDAKEAQLGELVVELAGHDALREPLVVDGHDLGLDEGAEGLPERLVILVEHRTAHAATSTHIDLSKRLLTQPYRRVDEPVKNSPS